jgi:all-trans-8'-apo-beta-carotenal 15,15'-oxygenase
VNGLLETPVLAAHYRVVREEDGSRTWVAFSSNSGLGGTELIFYEIAGE